MKRSILSLFIVTLTVATIATGCAKKPYGVTPLKPGQGPGMYGNGTGPVEGGIPGTGTGGTTGTDLTNPNGIPTSELDTTGRPMDREALKSQTVYFAFDSSVVRSSEHAKLKAVSEYLSANSQNALLIEGHCDERGTDEYNRSLGERRALALREYLANSGVTPDRVRTLSYGKDQPADPGHDEAAWSRNRRGVFVVLLPKP